MKSEYVMHGQMMKFVTPEPDRKISVTYVAIMLVKII